MDLRRAARLPPGSRGRRPAWPSRLVNAVDTFVDLPLSLQPERDPDDALLEEHRAAQERLGRSPAA